MRPTDFYQVNFNDKGWDDLKVPGLWELNGYGDPIYVNVGYPWRSQFKNNRLKYLRKTTTLVLTVKKSRSRQTGKGKKSLLISALSRQTCIYG